MQPNIINHNNSISGYYFESNNNTVEESKENFYDSEEEIRNQTLITNFKPDIDFNKKNILNLIKNVFIKKFYAKIHPL